LLIRAYSNFSHSTPNLQSRNHGSIVSLNRDRRLAQLQNTDLLVLCRSILGFPRMGVNRDLKKATEAYWGGKLSQADLLSEAKRLRLEHWNIQKKAGVDVIPSNDFALYDQVLHQIQDFGVSFLQNAKASQQC
jgi:hypothetical protein